MIVIGYRGVPKKTVKTLRKAYIKSYKFFGKRPIANTYALFWHSKKSNLTKVAKKWYAAAGKKDKACLTEGGGWGFDNDNVSSGGFETLSLNGLNEGTEGWWKEMAVDDGHLKTVTHEYFHVYQNMMVYYFEKENRLGIPKEKSNTMTGPVWMVEGGADYFAYNIAGKYKWKDHKYKDKMKQALVQARAEIARGKKKGIKDILKNYATDSQLDKLMAKGFRPHFQYDGGAWANAYLHYLKGTNKGVFTNYYKDIAELERTWRRKGKMNYGWQKSFLKNFGMTVNRFYVRFNKFMKWPTSRQMTILSAPLS